MIVKKTFSFLASTMSLAHQLKRFQHFTYKDYRGFRTRLQRIPDLASDDLITADSKYAEKIEDMVEKFKKTQDHPIHPKNMGIIMYQCGLNDLYEPSVFQAFERNMHLYKGQFGSRLAFGCLYGLFRTNAGTINGIEFFKQEVLDNFDDITLSEAFQLLEALSLNKQLSKEEAHAVLEELIKPKFLQFWQKSLQHQKRKMIRTIEFFLSLEYYDEELWGLLLSALRTRKSLASVDPVSKLYELFSKLQEGGNFPFDLTEDIAHYRNLLETKPDHIWRYNVEEKRFYTYEELKAKRNDYRYTDQRLAPHWGKELYEEVKSVEGLPPIEDEEQGLDYDRNSFSVLLAERFDMVRRGNVSEMDDEDTFRDSMVTGDFMPGEHDPSLDQLAEAEAEEEINEELFGLDELRKKAEMEEKQAQNTANQLKGQAKGQKGGQGQGKKNK